MEHKYWICKCGRKLDLTVRMCSVCKQSQKKGKHPYKDKKGE
jgi:hypothetical protein